MRNNQDAKTPLPSELLSKYSKKYPMAWRQINSMREGRGKDLPWWPDWCYCPIAGAVAIVTEGAPIPLSLAAHNKMRETPPGIIAALAAWRVTKGIYRFDPGIYSELIDMPLEGAIPANIFYQLPEWCIYIETPGLICFETQYEGVFVHLEHDAKTDRAELRFMFSNREKLLPFPLHIGDWTVEESLKRVFAESQKQKNIFNKRFPFAPPIPGHEPDEE